MCLTKNLPFLKRGERGRAGGEGSRSHNTKQQEAEVERDRDERYRGLSWSPVFREGKAKPWNPQLLPAVIAKFSK